MIKPRSWQTRPSDGVASHSGSNSASLWMGLPDSHPLPDSHTILAHTHMLSGIMTLPDLCQVLFDNSTFCDISKIIRTLYVVTKKRIKTFDCFPHVAKIPGVKRVYPELQQRDVRNQLNVFFKEAKWWRFSPPYLVLLTTTDFLTSCLMLSLKVMLQMILHMYTVYVLKRALRIHSVINLRTHRGLNQAVNTQGTRGSLQIGQHHRYLICLQ